MLRSYHNPDVREGSWTRMFDRRLPAVVPMDHKYLAQHDGSEMASGRGMGLQKGSLVDQRRSRGVPGMRRPEKTPYMHMTFWPLERRLDTAVFRALFASSTRQARQFVLHGYVTVNGKKMVYPGYQLNPGDMFSVDPDKVMFATGEKKGRREKKIKEGGSKALGGEEAEPVESSAEVANDQEQNVSASQGEGEAAADAASDGDTTAPIRTNYRRAISRLMARAQEILNDHKTILSGKRRVDLREFIKKCHKTHTTHRKSEMSEIEDTHSRLEVELEEIVARIPEDDRKRIEAAVKQTSSVSAASPSPPQRQDPTETEAYKEMVYAESLAAALERARDNPIDPSKPYATPWRPRDFMSAFAFIPRYLEVNQNICSAVYLRHPVARPGLGEVPTPFSAETMALGFNWYLRRR